VGLRANFWTQFAIGATLMTGFIIPLFGTVWLFPAIFAFSFLAEPLLQRAFTRYRLDDRVSDYRAELPESRVTHRIPPTSQ
jgi:hypothetical protein